MTIDVRWDSPTPRRKASSSTAEQGGTPTPVPCPFVVVVDSREQHPYGFTEIVAAGRQVAVTTVSAGLRSGDYSIVGHEEQVAVERKSLADLYSTFTAGRDRFERELERLQEMAYSVVIVEASWHEIANPPFATRINPASITGSIFSMMQRYPRTHWLPAGSRPMAEAACYAVLRRYWLDAVERPRKDTNPRRETSFPGSAGNSASYTAN